MVHNRSIPVLFAVTAVGVSSVITQITLTRELLNIFHGNELVMGLVISAWLLLTGVGAFLGRYQKWQKQVLVISLVLVSLLPFVHLIALRYLRNVIAVPGAALDPRLLLTHLPLLLLPYCLVSGYLLTLACSLFTEDDKSLSIGTVYFIDNIGDILGGVLFSFVLVFITTTFNSLFVPGIVNAVAAVVMCRHYQYRRSSMAVSLLLPILVVAFLGDIDSRSLSRLFPSQDIVHVKESLYGRIVVTRDEEQHNLFENGIPFFSTGNVLDAEESVHFALSQLPDRELSVLLISGGVTGIPGEIAKYPVKKIDYVELDPAIIEVGRMFTDNLKHEKLHVHTADGRKFVEKTGETYDAIIVDLPPPSNLQINRFYTVEFFTALKKALAPDGVVSFSLPGAENYVNKELSGLYRVMYSTARHVFAHVKAYPAGEAVFVLSDRNLGYDIGEHLTRKGIDTRYVNSHYLAGMLTQDRIDQLNEHLALSETLNRDLSPSAFLLQLRYWLSFFDFRINRALGLVVLVALLYAIFAKPVETTLSTTGFVSVSVELMVLFLLQIHSGYVYRTYGLMITLFMVGLSVGSFMANRQIAVRDHHPRKSLVRLELTLIAFLALLAAVTGWTDLWRSNLVLYFSIMAFAMVTGAEFPMAGAAVPQTTQGSASRLYTADFLGAGIGSLVTATLMVPVMGVRNTLVALLAIKVVSLTKLLRKA